ncbi:MAG: galactose ABC transporter substrate-binding protein [Pseudobutyrivibrio sp.]|nr:galactose ABC transporter substrate-binding protein [Pseudobutyrivibrio sp.]
MFKRLLSRYVILAVMVSLSFSGCTKGEEETDKKESIKVGITMYTEFDPFTEDIRHNIEDSLAEYAQQQNMDITTTVMYSGKNQLVQNDQVEDFIERGYDVICVNIVDRTDATVIIEKAKSADVPIIFFNREVVEDDLNRFDKLYYVGAKAEESGIIQGEIVLEALKEKFEQVDLNQDGVIQYVMLEGEAGHQDAIVRSRVSVETIINGGVELERLGDEMANWDRQQAHTKLTALLQGYPRQIELVIANDDNMALGAVDALKEFGVQTMPMVVGVNGQQEALEAIAAGDIDGTALNNAKEKGRVIAMMATSIARYGQVDKSIELTDGKYYFVPYEKIDKNNVDSYLE